MGLDVYLYRYKGMKPFKSMEEALGSHILICKKVEKAKSVLDDAWKDYQNMTESEKDALRESGVEITKKVVKDTPWENSLDKWGDVEFSAEEQIPEEDSVTKPDHMFKIGYFRSSYNSGGINSVLNDNGLMDLYGIFEVNRDNYRPCPNWKKALKNVKKVIKDFEPLAKEGLACMDVSTLSKVDSAAQALEVYRAELKKHKEQKSSFDAYSSAQGVFYLGDKPIQARGFFSGKNCLGMPCTYIVYEVGSDEGMGWYLDSLKIVQETIEWVLAQPDPDSYFFHWSG